MAAKVEIYTKMYCGYCHRAKRLLESKGVQFHPELESKPFEPHPLFAGFIEAALAQSRLV